LNKEISLVIPVYNEHQTIVELLDEIEEVVSSSYKAYIVFDHDNDSTLTRREEIHAKFENINFIKNKYGAGVIGAFKTGFDIADSKYIVPIMADLSDMPESINVMYDKIQGGYDLVVASRYMKGGKKIGGPKLKYCLSVLSNSMLYFFTDLPLHDITNAFIMYRKEVIKGIKVESTGGFEITMEIIAKSYRDNRKMTEVPTINRDRAAGQSNFKMMTWMKNYCYWFFYILNVYVKKKMK